MDTVKIQQVNEQNCCPVGAAHGSRPAIVIVVVVNRPHPPPREKPRDLDTLIRWPKKAKVLNT